MSVLRNVTLFLREIDRCYSWLYIIYNIIDMTNKTSCLNTLMRIHHLAFYNSERDIKDEIHMQSI